nr:phospholipase D family protein [Vibrio ulleungensis]
MIVLFQRLKLVLFIVLVSIFSGCASIDGQQLLEKSETTHLGYQSSSALAKKLAPRHDIGDADTGFYPLSHGHDALLARLALIENAQFSLDVQYYIYRSDETGNLITWRLFEAAERGVRVRLLLDDMQKRNDEHIAHLNAHPNIEIRLFNPHQFRNARITSMATDFERLNRRMHNKSITADSVASIVGGRNVGNEYFSVNTVVDFGDFDMLLYGKAVEETSEQFDEYWNSLYAVPMELIFAGARAVTEEEMNEMAEEYGLHQKFSEGEYDITQLELYQQMSSGHFALFWGQAEVWYDLPQKVEGSSSELVLHLSGALANTQEKVMFVSPYFVPTEYGTQQMVKAVKRGKKITIITNSLASNDVFAVHGWYAKYREDLVRGGVEIWELKDNADLDNQWSITGSSTSSLHAKVIMFDRRKMFVGSMNFDPRSLDLNTEMGVLIHNAEFTDEAVSEIRQYLPEIAYQLQLEDDELVWKDHQNDQTYTQEPNAGLLLRMGAWFAGILPIEHLL